MRTERCEMCPDEDTDKCENCKLVIEDTESKKGESKDEQ